MPNKIFFGGEAGADLNAELDTRGKRVDVDGLVDIFSSYKFTVEENTPLDEEVALDPELLGKIFENLLASYNEDTKSTARKLSGSFYTPREVVDYMVDEALIAYFERALFSLSALRSNEGEKKTQTRAINEVFDFGTQPGELDLVISSGPDSNFSSLIAKEDGNEKALEVKLRNLLSYADIPNEFTEPEAKTLIAAIEQLKIFDPACGSGAFPMGILNKLVHVIRRLDPGNELWKAQNLAPLSAQLTEARKIPDPSLRDVKVEEAEAALEKARRDFANTRHADYTRKLYLIEKCIFGADIQPVAVQIAKLRFFIALVVSQDVDKAKDNWGITALPNLETKIVAADSLMPIREVKHGMTDQLGQDGIKTVEAELHDASERYFSARSSKTKRRYREKIQSLRDKLADELEKSGFSTEKAQQLVHWNPFDQNSAADFFDPEWMFQLGDGFDVVIGNPPYVNAGAIRDLKPRLRTAFVGGFFDGNADLFTYFYRRGFDLLRPSGVLTYISSNKFMRTGYGLKTRRLLSREGELLSVIDFGELPVFGASVDSAIVVVRRPSGAPNPAPFRAVSIKTAEEIPIAGKVLVERGELYCPQDLSDDGWLFESSLVRSLLERMQGAGKRLDDIVQGRFYYGIKTGLNEAFVIDGATRQRLISQDANSKLVIKPFLNGREMLRWRCDYADQWLIYVPWHFPLHQDSSVSGASQKAEQAFKVGYPAIYSYLTQYKEKLLQRNQDETGIRYEWYALQRWGAEYWTEFEKRKLVLNETSKELHAFIDDDNLFINKTGFMILHEEIDYLLGIMNSTVLDYYYRHNFPCWGNPWNGGRIQFRKDRMVDAPIPWPEKQQRDLVTDCVKAVGQICKKAADAVGTTVAPRFEQLINGLVYELFFPEDLHQANIRLFDACEKESLAKLSALKGEALADAAAELATRIFAANHQIYGMLHDLQGLPVVRLIEGHD